MRQQIPETVSYALAKLRQAGFEAWLVGGCVRDHLMGRTPSDYDITTSAEPSETEAAFAGERLIETGLKHGTVTVLLGGEPLEITTFRTEGAYSDGRHPDSVAFTRSLREDLARRDFTMNAIAWDGGERFEDPFGGRADIAAGCIRCVGDPRERFREDGLRILRAVRFAAALGFEVEEETAAAARECRGMLARISGERIYAELTKLLTGGHVLPVLTAYPEILCEVIPELQATVGFDQRSPYHCYDVYGHTVRVVAGVPASAELRLAALLHDAAKPACFSLGEDGRGHFYGHAEEGALIAETVLRRLHASNEVRERVTKLIARHMDQIHPSEKAVKREMRKVGPALYFDLLALIRADNLAQTPECAARAAGIDVLEEIGRRILEEEQAFTLAQLAVKGGDLMAAGIPAGPKLGETLDKLLELVIEGEVPNEKEALLKKIKM